MSDEKTKLRIKLGAGELEFEGGEQFLKDEVMPTIEKLLDLVGSRSELRTPSSTDTNGAIIQLPPESAASAHSTSTIATLLKANAASDLAVAAVAHLVLCQRKHRVTRDEILAEMKSAS